MTETSHLPARSAATRLARRLLDDLRERRQARAEYRSLERDLASYRTRSDIDDLLFAVDRQGDNPQAAQIRGILTRNSTDYRRQQLLAS